MTVVIDHYRITRTDPAGTETVYTVPHNPGGKQSFNNIGLTPGGAYRYRIVAVGANGATSGSASITAKAPSAITLDPRYRAQNCPPPTIRVTNSDELAQALMSAKPGDVIWLEDGIYNQPAVMRKSGTPSAPIWVCGSRGAIMDQVGNAATSRAIHAIDVHDVIFAGVTIRNADQGVWFDGCHDSYLVDTHISQVGNEGVHMRKHSNHCVVGYNTITETGMDRPQYGEGIYVGTSASMWPQLTNGDRDAADHNLLIGNHIYGTSAEPIEVKERVVGTIIKDNTLNGSAITNHEAIAVIQIRGEKSLVIGNTVEYAPQIGIMVARYTDYINLDNHFVGNHVETAVETAYRTNVENESIFHASNTATSPGSAGKYVPGNTRPQP